MTFDELWALVDGIPDTAKLQIPSVLSASTKKRMELKNPEEIKQIVSAAIDEVNRDSVSLLDELIKRKL